MIDGYRLMGYRSIIALIASTIIVVPRASIASGLSDFESSWSDCSPIRERDFYLDAITSVMNPVLFHTASLLL